MKDKIELMLKIYREKLEKAESLPHADHAEALRMQGAINVLEMLYIYALQESDAPPISGE